MFFYQELKYYLLFAKKLSVNMKKKLWHNWKAMWLTLQSEIEERK